MRESSISGVDCPAWTDESSDVESEEEDEDSDSECLEDKDQEAKAANKEQEPENGEGAARAKVRDDLNMYDKFFPELFEFQVSCASLTSPQ